jgi:hypothetical protein
MYLNLCGFYAGILGMQWTMEELASTAVYLSLQYHGYVWIQDYLDVIYIYI